MLVVVVVALCWTATVQAQVNPCRLLGKAEVRAALGETVTAVVPDLAEGGVPKCDFSGKRANLTVMVLDRQALEGRSLTAWLEDTDQKVPFVAVPGLGEEAVLASASAELAEGKPETLTSTAFLFARQGSHVLSIMVMVAGKGPSNEAVCKLARRALLRLSPD